MNWPAQFVWKTSLRWGILPGMQPTQTEQVTTTMGAFYQWADTPTTVAMVFALAGAVFVGIYIIRRIRNKGSEKKP